MENNVQNEIISSPTPPAPEKVATAPMSGMLGRLLVIVIILSLVSGIGGGLLGVWLYQKQSPVETSLTPQTINKDTKMVLAEDSAIIDVVKKASPAVVSIVISKDLSKVPGFSADPYGLDPFSQFFGFGSRTSPTPSVPNVQQIGAGSGFFVSSDGLILTNKHVVSDNQASYTVLTNDRKKYEAKVLAQDPVNDLAILKVDITNAPTLELSDSSTIQIGQRAIAIGNSLGQYQNTVTTGVVSGIGRSITAGDSEGESEQLEGVIQTDAAINPGNSGGPLLNAAGQVVGINTAVDREGQLVGFAIPSSDVKKALDSFKRSGKITRPLMGIRYMMITKDLADSQKLPRNYGALIVRGQSVTDLAVVPGGPADKAGIVENDIILEFNGTKLEGDTTISKLMKSQDVGSVINLKVYHRGEEKVVKVTLDESK